MHLSKEKPPIFLNPVSAGFPSPAEGYIENHLDLNKHLIAHPSATFFVRVQGDSMIDANIYSGDILVVDRSIEASNNKIVLAVLNNEFTVKRLSKRRNRIILKAENKEYPSIEVKEGMDFEVWGVVCHVIHTVS